MRGKTKNKLTIHAIADAARRYGLRYLGRKPITITQAANARMLHENRARWRR
jgi:hypothetical protein